MNLFLPELILSNLFCQYFVTFEFQSASQLSIQMKTLKTLMQASLILKTKVNITKANIGLVDMRASGLIVF